MSTENWIPDLGRLVVSRVLGLGFTILELQVRDTPESEDLVRIIASINNFSAQDRGNINELRRCKEQIGVNAAGDRLIREYATDLELRAIIRLWDSPISLDQWLGSLNGLAHLLKEEKARIAHEITLEKLRLCRPS